ncbi:MAG: alkene reductase [Marinobacter sp.]|uniref:alkene reductase n=2 Tax=Marinobacter sp. TaxID=50741 RepID=UPI003298F0AC
MSKLFEPAKFGDLALKNRVVMAPMTRSRSTDEAVPTPEMIDYYAQRAGAGLIVAEGTSPSADGMGYCRTPGIYSSEQIAAWRKVTDAVHAAGGCIVLQLMHCGRVATHHNKPAGSKTVAPSAIKADVELFTDVVGMAATDMPHELSNAEVYDVIEDYRRAAINAREAGFDGVELHGTSGYLPMQFMSENANQRTDEFGGSVENRVRFPLLVLEAMSEAIGAGRVGFRFCPGNKFNDISDSQPAATLQALLDGIAGMDLAYLHIMKAHTRKVDAFAMAREQFNGPLIINDGFDRNSAIEMIDADAADAVSFARHYIANPNLVERFKEGRELAEFDRSTLYSGGAAGYSDYPA